jgi:protein tyrosine/serine phosphatase
MNPVVNDVWRSARPEPENLAAIKAKFRTIISLEGEAEDQKEVAELNPVPVLSFPISSWQIYVSGISQDDLAKILLAITSARSPVLVHCQWGRDRTGLVIAAYRVRVCGWTKDAAMSEALAYGYRRWINWGLNRTWGKV